MSRVPKSCRLATRLIACAIALMLAMPQTATSQSDPLAATVQSPTVPPVISPEPPNHRFHLEYGGFENQVSNGFGVWWGEEMRTSFRLSDKVLLSGEFLSQSRPGESEQLYGAGAQINWRDWFYTNTTLNWGGANDPAAFFPRFRYDLTANLKLPQLPGVILTGGLTNLYFGAPYSGRTFRAGAIYYRNQWVFQGYVNRNLSRPGDKISHSVSGAVQKGKEGSYWLGISAGGGREAWQTLALTPQDAELLSYSGSVFVRKWLAPQYGIVLSYDYAVRRSAYRIHGLQARFFLDF